MRKRSHIIGIIPARAGSAGVVNKNLRRFAGKPLIAWAILTALASKRLHRVVVSTNDPATKRVALRYGARVIDRPDELATPTIGIEPTLRHAHEMLTADGVIVDGFALMMATNPLRQPFHITEAVDLFLETRADSVIAVNETPANHTPFWTLVRKQGAIRLFNGKPLTQIPTRRQDFPHACYARNDLVYVLKPKNLYEKKPNLYGKKVELYETSTLFEADINTPEEWHDAEIKFKRFMNAPGAPESRRAASVAQQPRARRRSDH